MLRRILLASIVPAALLLLAIAVPAAVRAGGGCHGPDGSVHMEGATTVIRMDTCSFAPTVARVPVGTEVRFLNTANIDHLVLGRSGTWGSQTLRPGQEYSETFTTAGTYPFECPFHPGMVGAIVVGGGVAEDAVAAPVTSGSEPTPQPTNPASDPVIGTDPLPVAVSAGAVGLAAGAIGGALVAAAAMRRRPTGTSTD